MAIVLINILKWEKKIVTDESGVHIQEAKAPPEGIHQDSEFIPKIVDAFLLSML